MDSTSGGAVSRSSTFADDGSAPASDLSEACWVPGMNSSSSSLADAVVADGSISVDSIKKKIIIFLKAS